MDDLLHFSSIKTPQFLMESPLPVHNKSPCKNLVIMCSRGGNPLNSLFWAPLIELIILCQFGTLGKSRIGICLTKPNYES